MEDARLEHWEPAAGQPVLVGGPCSFGAGPAAFGSETHIQGLRHPPARTPASVCPTACLGVVFARNFPLIPPCERRATDAWYGSRKRAGPHPYSPIRKVVDLHGASHPPSAFFCCRTSDQTYPLRRHTTTRPKPKASHPLTSNACAAPSCPSAERQHCRPHAPPPSAALRLKSVTGCLHTPLVLLAPCIPPQPSRCRTSILAVPVHRPYSTEHK